MKHNRITGRVFALLLTVALLLTMCTAVLAAEASTPTEEKAAATEEKAATGSITVSMQVDAKPLSGMTLRIYAVAQADVDALCAETMSVAEASEKYGAGKALSDDITKDGKLTFGSLDEGVYLILGNSVIDTDGITWGAEPLLVRLSEPDEQDPEASMNREVSGKPVKGNDRTMVKKWVGDTTSVRPASITINLKKNGTVVDSVILKPVDGVWSYTWTQERLEKLGGEDWASAEWSVCEKNVPTGYTEKVSGFTITNTYSGSGGGSLPNTGLVWWPVLLLAAAGVLCITVGILRRRKHS